MALSTTVIAGIIIVCVMVAVFFCAVVYLYFSSRENDKQFTGRKIEDLNERYPMLEVVDETLAEKPSLSIDMRTPTMDTQKTVRFVTAEDYALANGLNEEWRQYHQLFEPLKIRDLMDGIAQQQEVAREIDSAIKNHPVALSMMDTVQFNENQMSIHHTQQNKNAVSDINFTTDSDSPQSGTIEEENQPSPTPQEAVQKLRQTEEILVKKQEFLEKKIEQEAATAQKHDANNKRLALHALIRKEQYKKQLKQVNGTLSTIAFQHKALENAIVNAEILKVMGSAAKALKATHNHMDKDQIHDLMDDIAQQQEVAREIDSAIKNPVALSLMDAVQFNESQMSIHLNQQDKSAVSDINFTADSESSQSQSMDDIEEYGCHESQPAPTLQEAV